MDIVDDLRKDPYEEEQQYKREARLELGGILERAADEIERLRKTLRQIIELNPFNSNTGNASIQYVTQMLVKMTALAHEALKEKE